jgi:hypothetical protein
MEITWNDVSQINPKVSTFCSIFINDKAKEDFVLLKISDGHVRISAIFPKAENSTSYHFDITHNDCEFYFISREKWIYIEILNSLDDFENYFVEEEENGSMIARILREKYRETFADLINAGGDTQIDEDFNLYFIENFVNYILNNVYIEE